MTHSPPSDAQKALDWINSVDWQDTGAGELSHIATLRHASSARRDIADKQLEIRDKCDFTEMAALRGHLMIAVEALKFYAIVCPANELPGIDVPSAKKAREALKKMGEA